MFFISAAISATSVINGSMAHSALVIPYDTQTLTFHGQPD